MQIEGIRSVAAPIATAVTPSSAAAVEESTPPQAIRASSLPYISPVLQYDSDAAVAVLMFRDGGSGDVENQYPSKRVVREYQLRGREGLVPDAGEERGGEASADNRLLSLARGSFGVVSTSGTPGFGVSSGAGTSPTVAASPTVAIGGGGTVVSTVNFVA
ncbi:hypothetical protein [Niveispirillum sp. KHB5.9]|uniref:hypothetical protein n=1 Tax=Niveispirillum sp. KHB5.9 TaxID=3400269 RepID=UPI003A87ABBC